MKARGVLVCLGCALGAWTLFAGVAAAKPGYYVMPKQSFAEFTVKGSHGYRVQIEQSGDGTFAIASHRLGTVAYFLPAGSRARADKMKARFPGIGRISVRFHRRKTIHRRGELPGCSGGAETIEKGVFTGTIHLRGERAFTVVDAGHARGKQVTVAREVCKRSGGGSRHHHHGFEDLTTLGATAGRGATGAVSFLASVIESPQPFFVFTASLAHQRGKMFVVNWVAAGSEEPTALEIESGRKPAAATVSPPRPFSGSATFSRAADGSLSWTGDLEAELPGVGPVRLAGPRFEPTLCVHRKCQGSDEPIPFSGRLQPRLR